MSILPAAADAPPAATAPIRLGLAANWRQFALLVVINGFVGAMVGLERSVIPLAASRDFGVVTASATLGFIATFGLSKALANLSAGWLAERRGRRFCLIAGWLVALPVPLIIGAAPTWGWIVFANVLLGVSQGLAWSATVIMKIDLAGPSRRGLAMGINEFAGYLAVALAAAASGMVAARFGLLAGPATLGIGVAVGGLLLSLFFTRDTSGHARLERAQAPASSRNDRKSIGELLRRSLWRDRALFGASQAGFVNNLNDGMAWGLFPLFFAAAGLGVRDIALLVAIYPAVWGFSQLGTGMLSDRWNRARLIVAGMVLQGVALIALAVSDGAALWAMELALLGVGTALVYPTLLAAVADSASPLSRPAAIGVYRLWRDLGYVGGALITGVVADRAGHVTAIVVVGALTLASGAVVAWRLQSPTAS